MAGRRPGARPVAVLPDVGPVLPAPGGEVPVPAAAGSVVRAGAVGALVVVVALVATTTGLRLGPQDGGSPPATFLVLTAFAATVCVVVAAAVAGSDRWLCDRLLVVASLLAGYLAVSTSATAVVVVQERPGPVADLLTYASAAGFVPPLTALALMLVGLGRRAGARTGWTTGTLLGLASAGMLVGAAAIRPAAPFEVAEPLLPTGPLSGSTWGALLGVVTGAWMVAVVTLPCLLWWRVGRLRGALRMRTALTATAALLPSWTLLTCVLLSAALSTNGVMDEGTGAVVLSVAFALPYPFAAVVLGWAWSASPDDVRRRGPRVVGAVLGTATGVLVLLLAAFVGIAAATAVGVALLPSAVLATAVAGTLLGGVRARATDRLLALLDPPRAAAARLRDARGPANRVDPVRGVERLLRAALRADVDVVVDVPGSGWTGADDCPRPGPGPLDPTLRGHDGRPVAYLTGPVDRDDARSVLEACADQVAELSLALAVRERDRQLRAERQQRARSVREERHRLERDLHDGAQGRLVALALQLRHVGSRSSDPMTRLQLEDAVEALMLTIEELRALANGRQPRLLTEGGLTAALGELVRTSPVPLTVSVPPQRLSPAVETLGYLVVCEAVTNALKHAGAEHIEVVVDEGPERARIVVTDDGVGGADPAAGTGIRSLAERLRAGGGDLVVTGNTPSGTVVRAWVPCGS